MSIEKPSSNPNRTNRPHWIPVVAGVLRRGQTVLLGQRPSGHSLAGQWEFPGGKIERDESPEDALKRELSEELGIDAEVGTLLFSSAHTYGDVSILLLFYEVRFWKGELKLLQHSALKWVGRTEFHALPIPEANRKLLHRISHFLEDEGSAADPLSARGSGD